jgi:hypothetical protein
MIDLRPYFAGLITLLFGVGAGFAVKDFNRQADKKK